MKIVCHVLLIVDYNQNIWSLYVLQKLVAEFCTRMTTPLQAPNTIYQFLVASNQYYRAQSDHDRIKQYKFSNRDVKRGQVGRNNLLLNLS